MEETNTEISLTELAEKEWLTVRSINICNKAGLTSLNKIIKFYSDHGSFMKMQNCGQKTEKELIEICKKYNTKDVVVSAIENLHKQENEIIAVTNNFNPFKKAILNRHFEYMFSNLTVRAQNGLGNLSEHALSAKNYIEIVCTPTFGFHKIRNIGNTTITELNSFTEDLISFVKVIDQFSVEQLSKEYTKLILKTNFRNLSEDFNSSVEQIFDQGGRIKLFKLINLLIESDQFFNKNERTVFCNAYANPVSTQINMEELANTLKLSKERVRRMKITIDEEIPNYFKFINNFNDADLMQYHFGSLNDFLIIDEAYSQKLNNNEGVSFNHLFYAAIFGILYDKTHSILGDDETLNGKRKNRGTKYYKNCYIIKNELFGAFNFDDFVCDISLKLAERITDNYSLHFEGYLLEFINENSKQYLEIIKNICKNVLFQEFDMVVNSDGYILFEKNTRRPISEYVYEILEETGHWMTSEEIANAINNKYPELETTEQSVRPAMQREKEYFIFRGRSSTYGLKKWETEKENFKGGTIRDIVEEYLLDSDTPKHISEILKYVQRYRATNAKSISSNIKIDQSNRFVIFKKAFIGLRNKNYNSDYIESTQKQTSWKDKVIELEAFRIKNPGRWPSIQSEDLRERALYTFGYNCRIAYQKNRLDKEKEVSLRAIGFPIDQIISNNNDWHTEINKLKIFINSENKWPSANSKNKEERALYRFCYLNKKAYHSNKLEKEKIDILNKIKFNFKLLR